MFAYSRDGERYEGTFATPEEAAREYFDDYGEEDGRCWVGRCAPPPAPEGYFDIEDLIDTVSSQDAYCGEWAEDWIDYSREQRQEINDAVQQMIGAWLDRHGLRPSFFNIEDAQEWELVDGEVQTVKI